MSRTQEDIEKQMKQVQKELDDITSTLTTMQTWNVDGDGGKTYTMVAEILIAKARDLSKELGKLLAELSNI